MDISARQLSGNRDSQAVETQVRIAVFQSYSGQEIEPSFRGALWADIGLRYSLRYEIGKQRDQFIMQPGYVCFAALLDEGYPTEWQVDVPQRVQVSFGKATPLIPRDFKAVGQKSSHRLWLTANALSNQRFVFGRKRGFDFTGDALYPKLATWIGGGITTEDSLFHDEPKGFQFEQGGVMARTVFHDIRIVELAPFNVSLRIFAIKEPWSDNPATREKQADCSPRHEVARATVRIVAVAFVEERWNPTAPAFLSDDPAGAALGKCPLCNQFQDLSGVEAAAHSQARALVSNLASLRAAELDPPKASASVGAGHEMSPNVTK